MSGFIKILACLILLNICSHLLYAQHTESNPHYFFFPKSYKALYYSTSVGFSITRLPVALVDDEVNTVPMLRLDFRMGVCERGDISFAYHSNYLANLGSLGFHWMILDSKLAISLGENTSVWFGHLEFGALHLKSMGVVVSPVLSIGYNAEDFTITANVEAQSSYMKTLSEDEYLGEFINPFSAYNLRFIIEQPLWNGNWVSFEIKLNYAKFYYQSWLTYSTVDEYFFYPEFSIGFNL